MDLPFIWTKWFLYKILQTSTTSAVFDLSCVLRNQQAGRWMTKMLLARVDEAFCRRIREREILVELVESASSWCKGLLDRRARGEGGSCIIFPTVGNILVMPLVFRLRRSVHPGRIYSAGRRLREPTYSGPSIARVSMRAITGKRTVLTPCAKKYPPGTPRAGPVARPCFAHPILSVGA